MRILHANFNTMTNDGSIVGCDYFDGVDPPYVDMQHACQTPSDAVD